ncbi:unnamed protein product [Protopolystoma xenopodis]|uniref:Uncharacterized protein n=1 Tax=Protopolystoma xenopodis TaxID=117903 RepID=A0A3S5CLC0_9PLAT|nr:unnamed protein product [Protopolystoma xenopodis]
MAGVLQAARSIVAGFKNPQIREAGVFQAARSIVAGFKNHRIREAGCNVVDGQTAPVVALLAASLRPALTDRQGVPSCRSIMTD